MRFLTDKRLSLRLTPSVFCDLAIYMVAFGLLVGLAFPYAVHRMGVPKEHVLSLRFHVYCVLAGLMVAGVNMVIANGVVRARLRLLASRLEDVRARLERVQHESDASGCDPEHCLLPVDSNDELGRTSAAFNQMAGALADALRTNSAVRRLGERLAEQLRPDEVARTAIDELLEGTLSVGGAVLLASGGQLQVAAARGLANLDALTLHPEVRRVFETQATMLIEVPQGMMLDRVLVHFPPRGVILMPVVHHGRGLGVVLLASDRSYTDEEIRRVRLLSRPLAMAFHNALAYEEMEQVAAIDGLTGCYNRRFGLSRLREEFARAKQMETPLGIILFDIDHFKTINDTWGHLSGDRVLMAVARQARLSVRRGDVLVRYGGEEFLVVLPFAGELEAGLAAERIRESISASPVPCANGSVSVTVSAGVAAWPETLCEDEMELVDLADAALYKAKRGGRNRVAYGTATTPSSGHRSQSEVSLSR